MVNWFKSSKIEQPITAKVGKAVISIKTIDNEFYTIPIQGQAYDWINDIYVKTVKDVYATDYVNTRSKFIKVSSTKSIPICNIKTMELTNIDNDFLVEVK